MRILNIKSITILLIILITAYLENTYIINLSYSELDILIPRFNFEMQTALHQPNLEQGFLSNIRTQSVLIYAAIFFTLNIILALVVGRSPHLFFVHLTAYGTIAFLSLAGLLFFTLFQGLDVFYKFSRIMKDLIQSPVYSILLIIYYKLIRHNLMTSLKRQ